MEDKKTVKVSLGVAICIVVIIALLVIIGIIYAYYIKDTDTSNEVANSPNTVIQDEEENTYNEEDAYEKYKDLYWLFGDDEYNTEIEFLGSKIVVEDGVAFLEEDGTKKKIETIEGKVKYITMQVEQTLESVYALTDDGKIWMSVCSETREKSDGFNDIFENINIQGRVINMTNGDAATRITEPPYFLLSTGELINAEGSSYEELEGNFKESFGSIEGYIFISQDNKIAYYNDVTRKYVTIKDENGNDVIIKEGFTQTSTSANDLAEMRRRYENIYCNKERGIIIF